MCRVMNVMLIIEAENIHKTTHRPIMGVSDNFPILRDEKHQVGIKRTIHDGQLTFRRKLTFIITLSYEWTRYQL